MAEVFGVAAGAVGVVSLSIQLAESLQKVKTFYESVKNAPLQVAELIEEIEIMQDILSDLEGGSQTVAPSANMKRCMKVAQKASKGFAKFSEELQASIKKRRYRGGVRFTLNRDEIKQMLDQLERTKSLLILAHSLYQRATAENRHITMMQAVSSSQASVMQTAQMMSQNTLSVQESSALVHGKGQMSRNLCAVDQRLSRINTPSWLSNTIWQLEMRRSVAGFNIFARTYGIVPEDAPIFTACRTGDTTEMQRLFDFRLASPYDKDIYGRTLWQEAARYTRVNSLRFLCPHYKSPDQAFSLSRFHRNATIWWLEDELPKRSGALSLREDIAWLHEVCNSAEMEGMDDHPGTLGALRLLACSSEDAESVLFWQALENSGYVIPLPPFSEVFVRDMLSRYVPGNHDGNSALQLLAVIYGNNVAGHWYWTEIERPSANGIKEEELQIIEHRLDYLEKTIAIAVSSGTNYHETNRLHTPMHLFLITCIRSWDYEASCIRPRALRNWLMFWLKTLQKAGVDLNTYGAEESRLSMQHRSFEDSVPVVQYWHYRKSWLGSNDYRFSYGPSPEDWMVELEFHVEDYVCEFWQMPGLYDEWPVRAIPGNWIDD